MSPQNKKKQTKVKTVDNAIATPVTSTATAPIDDTLSAASATRIQFRDFIELADLNTVKNFITTATSSPEGENLKLLWGRTFKEGLITGHQLYGKTEERLKEAHTEAYNEGFQDGYEEGRRGEHGDWALDGHGMHCGYQATIPYDDYGSQLNPTTSSLIEDTAKSMQTDTTYASTTYYSTLSTQTNSSDSILDATMSHSIQTNPKNAKIVATSENSMNFSHFSSPMSSFTISNSPASFTTTSAHEMHPETSDFAHQPKKSKNHPFSTQQPPKLHLPPLLKLQMTYH
jgi:hypothetical protein